MAITLVNESGTISTTEYSLPNDSTTLTAQTDDCVLQAWIDVANLVAGDEFEFKVYEKINAGTARVVYKVNLIGAQSSPLITPALIVGEGWDVTAKRIAGADRTINWSLRKLT